MVVRFLRDGAAVAEFTELPVMAIPRIGDYCTLRNGVLGPWRVEAVMWHFGATQRGFLDAVVEVIFADSRD